MTGTGRRQPGSSTGRWRSTPPRPDPASSGRRCTSRPGGPISRWRNCARPSGWTRLSQLLNVRLGTALLQNRRYAAAEAAYRQAIALDSTNVSARAELGLLLGIQHRFPEALAILRALPPGALDLQGGYLVAAPLGYVYGLAGRRAEALGIQRHLQEVAHTRFVTPEAFAWVAIGLGDTTTALDWLERAVQERSFFVIALGATPVYDGLRSQPRFQRIIREVGITLSPMVNRDSAP